MIYFVKSQLNKVEKKYCDLSLDFNWEELLPRLEADKIFLLNKGLHDAILAWGEIDQFSCHVSNYDPIEAQRFIDHHKNKYVFSYVSYDLKNNETRNTSKENLDETDLFFFAPEHVIIQTKNSNLYFGNWSKTKVEEWLTNTLRKSAIQVSSDRVNLTATTPKSDYLNKMETIKRQIQAGIIYEMNYCLDFSGEFESLSPVETYIKLIKQAKAPFSCFVRHDDRFVLSASPERFMIKKRQKIASQPIKGTAKRGSNLIEDQLYASNLSNDPKEIAENIMIVDLVRNDLSKLAEKNSVRVDELCQIYSFETVHQLISTISCELKPEHNFTSILQALFPMGSMTGAPKISAMQQIDKFEDFNRGIYSGSIGFIEPNGNFDFNVVIRSILVNKATKKVNCRVGGAITIQSIAENEYSECLLKLKVLQSSLC